MCVDSFIGIKNADGTISYIQGRFETNDLGMWLHCNMFNIQKVRRLIHENHMNEKPPITSLHGFVEEGLKDLDVIYLWENNRWLEKTKESDWHEIGDN